MSWRTWQTYYKPLETKWEKMKKVERYVSKREYKVMAQHRGVVTLVQNVNGSSPTKETK